MEFFRYRVLLGRFSPKSPSRVQYHRSAPGFLEPIFTSFRICYTTDWRMGTRNAP